MDVFRLERVRPRPAGGQVQRPSPGGAGEPAGQGQQGAPQRLGDGLLLADAQAEDGGPAQQVVGQGSRHPGSMALNWPDGRWARRSRESSDKGDTCSAASSVTSVWHPNTSDTNLGGGWTEHWTSFTRSPWP